MKPAQWIPPAAGAVLGFALALFYAWNVNPVRYTQTAPSSLKPAYQEEYLALIAAAYQGTGDLDRAEARLALFDYENPVATLEALAQELLVDEDRETEARALAQLAADLDQNPTSPVAAATSTPRPGAASTPAGPTASARPTLPATASPTPGPPFELVAQESICPGPEVAPLLQVEVENASGEPVPGVAVQVLWQAGQDRFFTGLKPELGLGYADFRLEPDLRYTVQLADGGVPITDIQTETCDGEGGEDYPGSLLLRFRQPGS